MDSKTLEGCARISFSRPTSFYKKSLKKGTWNLRPFDPLFQPTPCFCSAFGPRTTDHPLSHTFHNLSPTEKIQDHPDPRTPARCLPKTPIFNHFNSTFTLHCSWDEPLNTAPDEPNKSGRPQNVPGEVRHKAKGAAEQPDDEQRKGNKP